MADLNDGNTKFVRASCVIVCQTCIVGVHLIIIGACDSSDVVWRIIECRSKKKTLEERIQSVITEIYLNAAQS